MASVSVVLPTRDRPALLLEALQTVASQSHLEMELILVRDGGVPLDGATRDLLAKLEFPATLVERDDPPEGLASARNRGIERARGDVVAFLDDDDLWGRGHVKQLADALDREAETTVVYSDAQVLDHSSGAEREIGVDFGLDLFGRDGFIPPSSFAARRGTFDQFGLFDPTMIYSEDWDWLLRVAHGGGIIARVRGVSATIRIHSGGLSALVPERLTERQRCLDVLSQRFGLGSIKPKTFWEVAGTLCPDGNASRR